MLEEFELYLEERTEGIFTNAEGKENKNETEEVR